MEGLKKLEHIYTEEQHKIKIELTEEEKQIIKMMENYNPDAWEKMTGEKL